jgi:ribonuclease HI
MEVGLRRLQRQAAARADRQRRISGAIGARLFTDGGARGNPGPAAYGFVLEDEDGTVLASEGEPIGIATNNVAEYSGLIAGLRKAVELQLPAVEVVSDSELMVKQMRGEYRVKNAALRELSVEAGRLARELGKVEYRHVKRAHNELADKLVNDALDAAE